MSGVCLHCLHLRHWGSVSEPRVDWFSWPACSGEPLLCQRITGESQCLPSHGAGFWRHELRLHAYRTSASLAETSPQRCLKASLTCRLCHESYVANATENSSEHDQFFVRAGGAENGQTQHSTQELPRIKGKGSEHSGMTGLYLFHASVSFLPFSCSLAFWTNIICKSVSPEPIVPVHFCCHGLSRHFSWAGGQDGLVIGRGSSSYTTQGALWFSQREFTWKSDFSS